MARVTIDSVAPQPGQRESPAATGRLHWGHGRVEGALIPGYPFSFPSAFRAIASHRLVRATNSRLSL